MSREQRYATWGDVGFPGCVVASVYYSASRDSAGSGRTRRRGDTPGGVSPRASVSAEQGPVPATGLFVLLGCDPPPFPSRSPHVLWSCPGERPPGGTSSLPVISLPLRSAGFPRRGPCLAHGPPRRRASPRPRRAGHRGRGSQAGVVTLVFGAGWPTGSARRPAPARRVRRNRGLLIALLASVRSPGALPTDFALYGLTSSFIDLGANTVGVRPRTRLRPFGDDETGTAGFSFGALLGALLSTVVMRAGVGFRAAYVLLAVVLIGAALAVSYASLPPRMPCRSRSSMSRCRVCGACRVLPGPSPVVT